LQEFLAAEEVPFASGAPIWQRPAGVAPDRWPWAEFREIDMSADFVQVAEELRDFLLICLEWARARSGVDSALDTRGTRYGLSDYWVEVMLRSLPDRSSVEPGPAPGASAGGNRVAE
jgi:hypothetical protein